MSLCSERIKCDWIHFRFSGEVRRMGKDKDMNTDRRVLGIAKLARIMGDSTPNENFDRAIEYFMECSQDASSASVIMIIAGKEDQELTHELWSFLIQEQEQLTQFDIQFEGRTITIHFPRPQFTGDGKTIFNLLCLGVAFCFLCDLTTEEGQESDRLEGDREMKINRSLTKLHNHWSWLERHTPKNKTITKYYNTEERQGLCDRPIPTNENICNPINGNTATQHLYSHIFDQAKSMIYQMGSRNRTESGRTAKEEKELDAKKKKKNSNSNKERPKKRCEKCQKQYSGFTFLYNHVKVKTMKGKRNKCHDFYHGKKLIDLGKARDNEIKLMEKPAIVKTDGQKAYQDAKDTFTFRFKQVFGHAVNQVKVAGHGASVGKLELISM